MLHMNSRNHVVRPNLSFRETIVLADVPETRVRKDIESGRLPRRHTTDSTHLWFRWLDVYCFAAIYSHPFISARGRKLILDRFEEVTSRRAQHEHWTILGAPEISENLRVEFGKYLYLDLCKAFDDVEPRVAIYALGLSRIEERRDVLAGEPIFRNSRLPVRHIGEMAEQGESVANILEDYPSLTPEDVEFARFYFRAHPVMGRPRKGAETGRVAQTASR